MLLERDELRAAATERSRQQAQLITMEVFLMLVTGAAIDSEGEPIADAHRVRVSNESAEPIHAVSVRFGSRQADGHVQVRWVNYRAAGGRWMPTGSTTPLSCAPLIGAEEKWDFVSPDGVVSGQEEPVLFFRDNAGVHWRRDKHGDLREVAG
ncbi:hypothetical protein ABZS98_27770 [Streptomyces avermitilis]|uniref:hypothetical protein n=1 Tax=Streptomyces avermitilis TaxID=33903 RepID=UPI0033B40635